MEFPDGLGVLLMLSAFFIAMYFGIQMAVGQNPVRRMLLGERPLWIDHIEAALMFIRWALVIIAGAFTIHWTAELFGREDVMNEGTKNIQVLLCVVLGTIIIYEMLRVSVRTLQVLWIYSGQMSDIPQNRLMKLLDDGESEQSVAEYMGMLDAFNSDDKPSAMPKLTDAAHAKLVNYLLLEGQTEAAVHLAAEEPRRVYMDETKLNTANGE